jgi:hypothetical protein
MPAVKFTARLDLEQICLFLDGHKLGKLKLTGKLFGGAVRTGRADLQK